MADIEQLNDSLAHADLGLAVGRTELNRANRRILRLEDVMVSVAAKLEEYVRYSPHHRSDVAALASSLRRAVEASD